MRSYIAWVLLVLLMLGTSIACAKVADESGKAAVIEGSVSIGQSESIDYGDSSLPATEPVPEDDPPAQLEDGIAMTGWVFDGFSELPEVPEPSGLCYHPGRDTLFIVDDGGLYEDSTVRPPGIYELDLHAEVLNSAELGEDLEGVCYCEADGMLYVVDEMDEMLYVVNPDGLTVKMEYQVSRYLDGAEVLTAGGNGFEGIEFIPDDGTGDGDYFLLLNQDDPHGLVRIEREHIIAAGDEMAVPLSAFTPLAPINAGELHYDADAGELWVIHSWMNVVEILDVRTLAVLRWEVCPGAAQEAVAVDGQGRLWIGYDLGGISRYVWQETE